MICIFPKDVNFETKLKLFISILSLVQWSGVAVNLISLKMFVHYYITLLI